MIFEFENMFRQYFCTLIINKKNVSVIFIINHLTFPCIVARIALRNIIMRLISKTWCVCVGGGVAKSVNLQILMK